MPKRESLISFTKKSAESNPRATARLLESLKHHEAADILKALSPSSAEKVLANLTPVHTAHVFEHLPQELVADLLNRIDTAKAMGIFVHLPEDCRNNFIEGLNDQKRDELRELFTYPKDSVGRLMTTYFLTIPKHATIREAIAIIRSAAHKRMAPSYAYVTDTENRLCGVLTMRDTLLAEKDQFVESVMVSSVFKLDPFMDAETAAAKISAKKYFAAPVVDGEDRLLGIVSADQLLKDAQEEAAQDIQQIFGVSKDETVFSSFWFSARKRLPWLQVNLVTAFAAASVVALFEDVIAKITALAVFLPVVAGQGGNAGAQSLAVVMRGLVMREISPVKVKSVLKKETMLGAFNGLITGIITAAVAWLWKGNPYLGLVIGLGMIVNLVIAGFSGAIIPLMMKKMGFDPAQCSSIILTTVTDVVGFLAFLGFAVLFQDFLV